MRANRGFTLIELSIVLVIIGLIVGGILVGRDLIRAAEIRAQVSQIEKYNTSVNTFKNKYGYVPGDLPAAIATQLGFFAIDPPSGGTTGFQDGNGFIESGPPATAYYATGEILIFWRHLTDAQMIDGNFGTATSGSPLTTAGAFPGAVAVGLTFGRIPQVIPRAKIGRGNFIHVGGGTAEFIPQNRGSNYYQIAGIFVIGVNGTVLTANQITPIEAQNIDQKTDDGFPTAGKTQAVNIFANPPAAPCIVVATSLYDVGSTNGDVPSCALRIVMQ